MRALGALGAASRSQDRSGLAQRLEPKLGTVLSKLISLHLGTLACVRQVCSRNQLAEARPVPAALHAFQASRPAAADEKSRLMSLAPAAHSAARPEPDAVLADVAHCALFAFLDAFGVTGCQDALRTASQAPDFGTSAEQGAALLSLAKD